VGFSQGLGVGDWQVGPAIGGGLAVVHRAVFLRPFRGVDVSLQAEPARLLQPPAAAGQYLLTRSSRFRSQDWPLGGTGQRSARLLLTAGPRQNLALLHPHHACNTSTIIYTPLKARLQARRDRSLEECARDRLLPLNGLIHSPNL